MVTSDVPEAARLDGQVAVVTGGGRDLGRATAIRLAEAGASVMVTARTESEIEETAEQIRAEGGSAQAFPADVSDCEAVRRLAGETEHAFGPADILVANGGYPGSLGEEYDVRADLLLTKIQLSPT